MNARVSVVIPTFNYGRYIGDAIESLLKQTHPVAEIIVVDDGSTDETARIVSGFGSRLIYIKELNRGVSAARNKGIERSTGELIAFLDADDTWLPEKIAKQVEKFAEDGEIGLVHCAMREFDDKTGETTRYHLEGGEGWVAKEIALWENPIVIGPGGSIVVRRDAIETVGGFDTELRIGEDWEFCFRVARKYKVGFVREPLVNYRHHGSNAHFDLREMERSTLIAWKKVFTTSDDSIRRIQRLSYGNLHKVLAGSYLESGHYPGFLRNVLKSIWYRPSYILYYLRLPLKKRG